MLKHYKQSLKPIKHIEQGSLSFSDFQSYVDDFISAFGPCDITVIGEPKTDPPGAAVLLKLVYAYNQYTERINKAEEYFKTASPEQATKFQPAYNELVAKASTALNEIRELRSDNQFDIYTYQETPEGYLKLFNYKGQEVILKLVA